jgi:hypothetical protein
MSHYLAVMGMRLSLNVTLACTQSAGYARTASGQKTKQPVTDKVTT